MTDLNNTVDMMALKSYTESCVHPSRASICSKILKFVEIGATAGSGPNYESSCAPLAIEKLETIAHRSKYSYFN